MECISQVYTIQIFLVWWTHHLVSNPLERDPTPTQLLHINYQTKQVVQRNMYTVAISVPTLIQTHLHVLHH